ncbi:hypothetical protein [Bacillus sp. Marseille-P3800]|uniref:hypothetical protein n=1 Tax=Bacillus sp. Marseille-P3800 TaxID=2014782 RepID=UPI000C07CC7C|nr:hypothetical protein [Bacillus sp. Marseille-P3800]
MSAYVQGSLLLRFEMNVDGISMDEIMEKVFEQVNDMKNVSRAICKDDEGNETINLAIDDFDVEIEDVEIRPQSKNK